MKTAARGLRALLRNPMRSGLLAALLAVSICLILVMLTVDSAFGKRMDEVKNDVGSNVTVTEPHEMGPKMSSEDGATTDDTGTADGSTTAPLTNDIAAQLGELDHVSSVIGELDASEIDSTLTAPPLLGPDGQPAPEGAVLRIAGGGEDDEALPNILTKGTSDPASILSSADTGASLIDGRLFTADEADADVAVISQALADENDLQVGDTFNIGATTIEVIGIVSGASGFAPIAVYIPLSTAQRVLEQTGELSRITLKVDDVDNVNAVAAAAQEVVGDDYEVETSLDQYERIAGTLEDAQNSSRLALIVCLGAASLVILFGIVLASRQRIKEIGVMKAVGAANRQVVAQFGLETLMIGIVAGLFGALITFPIAQKVADGLLSDNNSGGPMGGGGGPTFFTSNGAGSAASGVASSIDAAVSPMVFVYALLFAAALALISSIGPAWQVSRVRPAEVLRYE
jgi:ABC-type lipoprotein release transport system permease subunit